MQQQNQIKIKAEEKRREEKRREETNTHLNLDDNKVKKCQSITNFNARTVKHNSINQFQCHIYLLNLHSAPQTKG
jgi:hypothetical protein